MKRSKTIRYLFVGTVFAVAAAGVALGISLTRSQPQRAEAGTEPRGRRPDVVAGALPRPPPSASAGVSRAHGATADQSPRGT